MLWLTALAWGHEVVAPQTEFGVREKVVISVQLVAGPEGLQPGDSVVVDEPVLHGMRWSKWGWLTTRLAEGCEPLNPASDQASVGRVAAEGPAGVRLRVETSSAGPDIHEPGQIWVEVVDGQVVEGERITLFLGTDEADGDCGYQTPDRAMTGLALPVSVETADGDVSLIDTVLLDFIAEDQVASIHAVLPSQAVVGESVELRVVPLDRYGNVVAGESPSVELVSFDAPGVYRETVDLLGLSAVSNPIVVTQEPLDQGVYWGDLHTHHGLSGEVDGAWVDQNHAYGRDVMGLDFGCESVKAHPYEIDSDALWARVQRSCREYTVDGDYVALLGFEWMGGVSEGHHNVYYETCEGPLADMDMPDVATGLFPFMERTMADTQQLMVSIPHAPAYTGFNWTVADETLRPVAEVFSEWGSSMDARRQGSVPQGLVLGQRLGFIASSDNHDGWLGNGLSEKNTEGGIAAIRMSTLTPTDLLEGLLDRRSYATTGARMILDLRVWEDGEPHRMGDAWESREARFVWSAYGTTEIAQVRLMASAVGAAEREFEWGRWTPNALDATGEAVVPWGPRELAVWLEVTQVDREVGWTSPVYLERATPPEPSGCQGLPLLALPGLGLLAALRRRKRG